MNSQGSTCLSLPSAGIKVVHRHPWSFYFFILGEGHTDMPTVWRSEDSLRELVGPGDPAQITSLDSQCLHLLSLLPALCMQFAPVPCTGGQWQEALPQWQKQRSHTDETSQESDRLGIFRSHEQGMGGAQAFRSVGLSISCAFLFSSRRLSKYLAYRGEKEQ